MKRILLISDLHFPAHHPDTFKFLKELKKEIRPDKVVVGGDEVNNAAFSFFDKNPDMPSAIDELKQAKDCIKRLADLFKEVSLLDGNHSSLIKRKAVANGIPAHLLRPYSEYLSTPSTWIWHNELKLVLPNKQTTILRHKIGKDILKASAMNGVNMVQFHFHTKFNINFWSNNLEQFFAMTCGCLIDDSNMAFDYNKDAIHRPVLGCAAIIDSKPILLPMGLK